MAFTTTDITNSYVLSNEGQLTIGSVKLGGYKSGSLTFQSETVDNSTRDDQGWTKSNLGKRSASLSVTFNKIDGDECQEGLVTLFLSSTYAGKGLEVKFEQSATEPTKGGFSGVFILTNYSESVGMDATAVECQITLESWGPIVALPGA